ncbi:hypothetical protein RND81_10G019400 [Saponaria officinalis]|uniref:NPH3 domain-containing protein n=1 Tax=Saponaria officinalis TaxID=3572 RepID=A0AAW1HXC7_SAPOF
MLLNKFTIRTSYNRLIQNPCVMQKIMKNVFQRSILMDQTEKLVEGIDSCTWSDLLISLKHCPNMLNHITNSVFSVQNLVDEIVERLALPSSKCSSFRFSCDSKSTLSTNSLCFRSRFWWFEGLSTLDIDLIELLVNRMVLKNFEHCLISRFLFYYQRVRVLSSTKFKRGEIIQRLISLLLLLDKRSISIKGLFETLRVGSNLKLRRFYRSQLELLIGFQLDQAEIDDLLLSLPVGKNYNTKYNVNIVLRFLKNFIDKGNISSNLRSYRVKRVARLVDQYACEIAPDDQLKPSKFIALIVAIPDSSRDSYDKLYQAVEIYLEVHRRITEGQKMKVCSVLNYNKLSAQVLNQLSRNPVFPLIATVKALLHSNPKLMRSINGGQLFKRSRYNNAYEKMELMYKDEVVLKELATNEKLRDHLQEIGWTLLEVESISSELLLLHAQKRGNVRAHNVCVVHGSIKHLPKLCS